MTKLTSREKAKLEKLFCMSDGYVLGFSDKTISEFFQAEIGINIHDGKYCKNGTSKANKVREFWRIEDDYLVGKSIQALITEIKDPIYYNNSFGTGKQGLIDECKKIAADLLSAQNLEHLKEKANILDSRHLVEQIKRMEHSIQEDPALAIGTAKELVETCCKTILAECGKSFAEFSNIQTLTKATLKELKLVPEGINNESRGSDVVKLILQNLGTICNGLAELRGLYGTGHGKDSKAKGLSVRHAKLAVGAASTLVTFLFDTHEISSSKKK